MTAVDTIAQRYVDETLETAPVEQIRELQWTQLQPLLKEAQVANPFYRQHWAAGNVDIDRVTSIESFSSFVPPVDKADFMADQSREPPFGARHDKILTERHGHVPISTSGSSGQGVELHLQTPDDVAQHSRVNEFYFRWAGLERGDITFLMMNVSLLAGGRCEFNAAVDYGLSVYPVGAYDTERRIELIKRFRPRALIATTSYLGHLAAKSGGDLSDLGIEILLCGAESASQPWFARLEASYGARAFDRYGLSQMATDHMFACERGIGTEANPGVLHNIDPFVLLEVIDPDTGLQVADGERGEIVLTSLYRRTVPIIRCRTNDSAVWRAPGSCRCGRSFSGIEAGSVQRLDDVKKIKGINIWPKAMDEAIFAFPEAQDYRAILKSDGTAADICIVEVLIKGTPSPETERNLLTRMARHLRHKLGISFDLRRVSQPFPETASAKKRRWIEERDHVLHPRSHATAAPFDQ